MSGELVLVTGGSGFLGCHCIIQLIAAGYRMRTTVRSLKRGADVQAMLKQGGCEPADRLSFAAADLGADAGWAEAVQDCAYVLHVASPFPPGAPKNDDEVIVPARQGALRVLKAARLAGVRRVVLTSSFAAIGYGGPPRKFTEADWTDLSAPGLSAYVRSKTLAERDAWDFVAKEGAPELAVVNPVAIFGPVLGPDYSTSIELVQRMLSGGLPAAPKLAYGIVDVRDVADLHIRAMTDPAAKGERFMAIAGDFMTVYQIGQVLKSRLGDVAAKVPKREAPNWLVRLMALVNPAAAQAKSELGKVKAGSNDKARRLLGWSPRSNEDAIAATGETLVKLGLVGKK